MADEYVQKTIFGGLDAVENKSKSNRSRHKKKLNERIAIGITMARLKTGEHCTITGLEQNKGNISYIGKVKGKGNQETIIFSVASVDRWFNLR